VLRKFGGQYNGRFLWQVLFDSLKKQDSTVAFRAYSLFALSLMIKHRNVGERMEVVQETLQLIERICQVCETHVAFWTTSDITSTAAIHEYDLLLVCLQRLINCTVPVVLDLDPSSNVMVRFVRLWEVIRQSSSNSYLEKESLNFVVMASLFPTSALVLDKAVVAEYLVRVIERRGVTSSSSMMVAVEGCRTIMLTETQGARQVSNGFGT